MVINNKDIAFEFVNMLHNRSCVSITLINLLGVI